MFCSTSISYCQSGADSGCSYIQEREIERDRWRGREGWREGERQMEREGGMEGGREEEKGGRKRREGDMFERRKVNLTKKSGHTRIIVSGVHSLLPLLHLVVRVLSLFKGCGHL